MIGELLLSLFPLGEHGDFFARLTCLAIDDFAQGEFSSRLVTREQLFVGLLQTSLKNRTLGVLADLDEYRVVQIKITLGDARALHLRPTVN